MAKPLRQARAVARLVFNWFRHDLPEIVAPSSMPDPPGIKRPPRKTRAEMQAVRGDPASPRPCTGIIPGLV